MGFARFMAGPLGRGIRILAGLVLIFFGYRMHSTAGTILAIVGLVPLGAGLFDVCLFAPLFGAPFLGKDVRTPR